jgi:CHAT domain-containing protein/tetratricopeptide (TPR) repeat protein
MANLAAIYFSLGRLAEALKLNEETLTLRRRVLGPEHPDTLMSMANLAANYHSLGRLAEALKLNEETLTFRRRVLGLEHPDTLASMAALAVNYFSLGRLDETLKLNEETLTLTRRVLGLEHPDTLASMANLTESYSALGRFDEALKLNEETLTLRSRILGDEHPATLATMVSLAASYYDLGRFAEALKLDEETLTLRRRILGDEHPDTLISMNNLAFLYRAVGRFAEAARLDEEALTLRRRTLGSEHPGTLMSMANLAASYIFLGRFAEAIKLNEEVLTLRRRILGPEHPDTLTSMGNLAVSYSTLGRFAEATKLEEEALALWRHTQGLEHPDTLTAMANLSTNYSNLGRLAEALKLDEETLALRRRILGDEHPATLATMASLATSYYNMGRFAEALKLNGETLTLRRRILGPEHPDTLATMANLATCYSSLGQLAEAVKLNEETLTLRRRILGPEHPDTLANMANQAASYYDLDRRPESLALRRESLEVIDHMAISLKTLPRDERSTALALYQDYYSQFAQALASSPADYAEALTVTERAKGRTLLEELTARQAAANSGIPADSAKRLTELRSQLEFVDGKLATTGNDETRKFLWVKRSAARAELDALHQDLLTKYPRYAALSSVKTVTLEQGRALLPADGAFISWLFDSNVSGVALALPKSGDLQVLSMTPGTQMIASAETYRWLYALPDADSFAKAVQTIPLAAWLQDGLLYIGAAEKQPAESKTVLATQYMAQRQPAITAHGQWLSDILLKPLTAQIDTASQWILSPDGVLATIPWDTLPWKGQPLGQQKQLTVIQSLSVYKLLKDREAENLSAGDEASRPAQTLMVMGGAKYGKGPDQQRSFQRTPQVVIDASNTNAAEYQRLSAYDYMRSRQWPNLAGSLSEAKVLHGLMEGQLLTGSDASETTLRELSQSGELASFSNLHFAAHGYLDTSVPSLSALVLTATGEDESNDGYITAGEWPAFNLKSDLLVMSACETGLGKIVSGEGVQGLPYALYVAGNRDTLLSLWQVSDNGTAVFMKRFWEKVGAGQNHAQALTETKREFQRGEFGKTYTEPYYWAPFILYGVQE